MKQSKTEGNPLGEREPMWTYSAYRATLYRDGNTFAIVTPDGRRALTEDQTAELLGLLNTSLRMPTPESSLTTTGKD